MAIMDLFFPPKPVERPTKAAAPAPKAAPPARQPHTAPKK
jgi:hypothetical protein